jgi:hypothetical protein
MANPTGACCPGPSAEQLHLAFLLILPRIEAHARVWSRHVACPGLKEDFVCEVVAICWRSFLRLAERGRDASEFASALASVVVKAVRSGRRLCGQQRARDAMSPAAQRSGGFRVEDLLPSSANQERLYHEPFGQRLKDAFEERLCDNTQTPVVEQVVFRLDFPTWLATLSDRNRRVIDDLMAGEGTGDVARKFGLTPGRVSQLRRQFEDDWTVFCCEPAFA